MKETRRTKILAKFIAVGQPYARCEMYWNQAIMDAWISQLWVKAFSPDMTTGSSSKYTVYLDLSSKKHASQSTYLFTKLTINVRLSLWNI